MLAVGCILLFLGSNRGAMIIVFVQRRNSDRGEGTKVSRDGVED